MIETSEQFDPAEEAITQIKTATTAMPQVARADCVPLPLHPGGGRRRACFRTLITWNAQPV